MSLIPQFAEIILPLPMRQSYTYSIPENLRSEASVGKRVVVQFGQRKMYTGLIRAIHNDIPDADNIKEILTILDEEELINPVQIKFWDWMSDYYMCTTGEIFKASLPSGLKLESESRLLINEFFEPTSLKSNDQELIYRVISENNSVSINDLVRLTGKKDLLQ
jgi:primosomal protein N' (replication factor Y)